MPGTSKDKIAVFCPKEEAGALKSRFKGLKNVEFIPAITFADDWEAAANAVRMAELAAYVIFGSKHSVSLFFEKAKELGIKNPLKNAEVFAAGHATAMELKSFGIDVAYAPNRGGLYEVYARISGMEHGPVIEISGSGAGKTDKWELAPGFMHIKIRVYSVEDCKLEFDPHGYSAVVFPSSLEVESLFKSVDYDFGGFQGLKAICIGRKALVKAKMAFKDAKEAEINTLESAIKASGAKNG